MRVDFSAAAKVDLIDIAVYIAQDNPQHAMRFVDELESKCLDVGYTPGIGVARPVLSVGIRMLTHGRYRIFYREQESVSRIERVMHGARDISSDDFDAAG